jgi:hypothetical protein
MVPKILLISLTLFWSLFLCASFSVYFGRFGNWIAYPTLISLILLLIGSWYCLLRTVYNALKDSRFFFLQAFILLALSALSWLAYIKGCLNPSENIFGSYDAGQLAISSPGIA